MGARKKVVFACVAVAALLALAEAGLRLAGCPVGPRLREVDWTLRECARFFPCVREGGAGGQHARVYSFPAGPTDRGMTFCARKPRGTLRLFCLGDSAAYGRPYFPQAAFSAWLARDLRIALPGRPIEVINAAQPGMDSFGVRLVAGEARQFQPDLVIVYCGNNEFLPHNLARARAALASPVAYRVRCALDRTALYGLFKDALFRAGGHPMLAQEAARPEVERKSHTDAEREWILRHFRRNLTALSKACSRAGARVIFCTSPTNLRDYDPNISRHSDGLSAEQQAKWRSHCQHGQRLCSEGSHTEAVEQFRRAETIDAQPAELHFQLAQCLEALGRWDDARAEYVRARDLDRYPLRATTAINEIIREACRETRGTLADLEAAFRRHSEHGLPGYDLFRDHCHLTLKAHRLVAFEVTRAMYEAGLLPPSPVGDGPDVCEPLDYDATLGLRTHDHAAACEEVGIQILREVSSRSPNTARRQRARLELQQAVALDPNRPNALLHLGLILAAEEQRDEATRLLRRALTLDPHIADGHAYALRVLREMGVVPDTRQAK